MFKFSLKNWLAKPLVLVTALIAVSVNANVNNPYVLMQQASDKLFSDIKSNQGKIKQNPNYLRTIVRNDLMPYIHVNYAGSLVLGSYFQSTTPEQRAKFFTVFGDFIEQSYAQVLTMYHDQKVIIEPEKSLDDKTIVKIRVTVIQNSNQPPIKLDFSWRKNTKTGEWQAYDMAAEGVSMVATKQQEWASMLRNQGLGVLIARIQKSVSQPITLSK